jgi:hypothetical protein
MAITMSDAFLQANLAAQVTEWNASPLHLALFTNPAPFVPSDDTALGTYVEATFCGYARQDLTAWSAAAEDELNLWWWTSPAAVRFCQNCEEACQTIYGIYAVSHDGLGWIFADLTWPSGIQFCHACDCIQVAVKIVIQDITPGHS